MLTASERATVILVSIVIMAIIGIELFFKVTP